MAEHMESITAHAMAPSRRLVHVTLVMSCGCIEYDTVPHWLTTRVDMATWFAERRNLSQDFAPE